MATSNITSCPQCGQSLTWYITDKKQHIGTCQHCTVTLEAGEWQRFADDPAFRARYDAAIAHAQVIAARPMENTGCFAVLRLTKDGNTTYATVEYQFEQEITCEVKFARIDGYTCEVIATNLNRAQAELAAQR